jgi:hypothetical protein
MKGQWLDQASHAGATRFAISASEGPSASDEAQALADCK